MTTTIMTLRQTTKEWEERNPVIPYDILGIEALGGGRYKIKRGDGVTAWASLGYFVSSVMNREECDSLVDDYAIDQRSKIPSPGRAAVYNEQKGLKSDKPPEEENDVVRLKELENISGLVSGDISGLEDRMNTAETDISGLETTTAGHTGDISGLKGRMNTAEGDISGLEGRMNTAEGDISGLEDRMNTAEGDISGLEGRMNTAEGDISGLEDQMNTAEGDISGLEDRMNTAEGDISCLETTTAEDISDLETGLGDANLKINALNGAYFVLEPYDFGKALDAQNADDKVILYTYAIAETPGATAVSDLNNNTVVINEFDNSEFIYNKQLNIWLFYPNGILSIATNQSLGVVKGVPKPADASKDGSVAVNLHGEMEVIGFNNLKTRVGYAETNISGKVDARQNAGDAGKVLVIGNDGVLAPGDPVLPQDGAATDDVIGPRALADGNADATLVPTAAKKLLPWLQGIRNNLKWLLSNRNLYKGANTTAGILIDLGAATIGSDEIIFNIIYNETASGSLIRQASIHGQVYGGAGDRTGMVQNGNAPVDVFYFQGTPEGIGNTHSCLWIPGSNTAYWPSTMVEAWIGKNPGNMSKMSVSVSTLQEAPVETLVPITPQATANAWVNVPYTAQDTFIVSGFKVKYNAALNMMFMRFDGDKMTTCTIGMVAANLTLPKSITGVLRGTIGVDMYTNTAVTGRHSVAVNVQGNGNLLLFPRIPTQATGAYPALDNGKLHGDLLLYLA